MTRDHNLLFGVFAVQLGKVTATQLMETAAAWAVDREGELPARLVNAGALTEADRHLIQRLVDEAVAAHGGDTTTTLAAFGGEEQIHRTYRGSIILTADGQVSIPPTGPMSPDAKPGKAPADSGHIKGVFETPGRYTELQEYGRGGMGRVLLVHDDHLGRDIALKELLPERGSTDDLSTRGREASERPSPVRFSAHILARFLQEARITGQLEHPSIVPVYELGHRRDGSLYYTMKLVRGRSLSKALKECSNLEERLRLLPHFVDLCQAIAYAHSRKIIHRDIKPANVMVGEFGETVVLDWGLAKRRDRDDVHENDLANTLHAMNLGEEADTTKTADGQILGTPVYMAPEQARGDLDEVDQQSDVYALGVVLFEILTGRPPVHGNSTREILKKVIDGKLEPVSAHEKEAPPELAAVAVKAMQRAKKARYQDARALAFEVQRFLSGALVHAHRYTIAGYTRFLWRRYRPQLLTASLALVVLIATVAVYTVQLANSRDRERAARKEAERTTEIAEAAREDAVQAREHADSSAAEARASSERANTALQQARQANYFRTMALAQMRIQAGETEGLESLLQETTENLRHWEYDYARAEVSLHTNRAQAHGVGGIAIAASPDGRYVATCGLDKTVNLWDGASFERIRELKLDTLADDVALSSDGDMMAVAMRSGSVDVLETESGTQLASLDVPRAYRVEFHPNGDSLYAMGVHPWALHAFDTATWEKRAMRDLPGENWSFDISPNGTALAAQGKHAAAVILDARTLEETAAMPFDWFAYSIAFGRTEEEIITGHIDGAVLRHIGEDEPVATVRGLHRQEITFLEPHPDGIHMLTASADGFIRWLNLETRASDAYIKTGSPLAGIATMNHGRDVVTLSADGTLRAWDVQSAYHHDYRVYDRAKVDRPDFPEQYVHNNMVGLTPPIPAGRPIFPFCLSYSSDGQYLATAGVPMGYVAVYGTSDYTLHRLIETDHEAPPGLPTGDQLDRGVRFRPGTHTLVLPTLNALQLIDAPTGDVLDTIALSGVVGRAMFDGSGARLFMNFQWQPEGELPRVALYDFDTGSMTTVPMDSPDQPEIAISGDGEWLAIARKNGGAIEVGNRENLAARWSNPGDGVGVRSLAFSPDGGTLAAGHIDGSVLLLDARDGTEQRRFRAHHGEVPTITFSPDGERMLTGGFDLNAKLWDWKAGEEVYTLKNRFYFVVAAAFSPDGKAIATGDWMPAVSVYDPAFARAYRQRATPAGRDPGD